MPYKMTQETIIAVAKVAGVSTTAVVISLSTVKDYLSIISLLLAIGYGIYKWRSDIKKNKK